MYRKFKTTFFSARSYIAEPASRQAHVRLVKIPVLLRMARAMQRSEALDLSSVGALARTQSEPQRSASVSNRFGLSGRLEQIESLRWRARRGAGEQA